MRTTQAIEQLGPVVERLRKYADRAHLQDEDVAYIQGLFHEAFALGLDEAIGECKEKCQWPPQHRLTDYGQGARDVAETMADMLESRAKWARERVKE